MNNPASSKQFPWALTICALAGVTILLGLGVWQIERLQWKTTLISELEEVYAQETAVPLTTDTATEGNYVQAKGIFLNQLSAFIQSKTHNSEVGRHLVTPFASEDMFFFVNRGWVSNDYELPQEKQTPAQISGFLKEPQKSNSFVPDNNLEDNMWYWANIDDLELATGGESTIPYIFVLKKVTPASDNIIPQAEMPDLKNDHLQYAFFWFAMATVLILIYGFKLASIMKK